MIGHEFSGIIEKVGSKWKDEYHEGERYVIVPEIPHQIESPGYSYQYFGGAVTYCIMPGNAIEKGCLLHYDGDSFFEPAIAQALYSVVGSFHSNYHIRPGSHEHISGIREGGNYNYSWRMRSYGNDGDQLCSSNGKKAKEIGDYRYQ